MQQRPGLFGLVSRTASWPQRIEAWSADGPVPFTVTYCPSVDHLWAMLRAADGPFAVLLDGDLPAVDRDLLADISSVGGAPVVVDGMRRRRSWSVLGAAAALPHSFDRAELQAVLRPLLVSDRSGGPEPPTAPLIGVTGPGGTGASVTAIALAQGLTAEHPRVLLADCCLRAEQAMLHDVHGAPAGLVDLAELHAERTPEPRQTRRFALGVVERGYHLLPGLTRARHWARLRRGSLHAALRSLRTAFDIVVADVDADVEGEMQGGAVEVEERNVLARTVATDADALVVVGQPTMKGVHALVRTMIELVEFGVPPQRLLPVVNQAAAHRAVRADINRAVDRLTDDSAGGGTIRPVLFTPRVELEQHLREREAVPAAWASLLAGAVMSLLDRTTGERSTATPEPVPAGTLGHWRDDGGWRA